MAVLCVWHSLTTSLQWEGLLLLGLGGAAYVSGIVFFVLGSVRPVYHCVWHLFVMTGSVLHWFAIYYYVVTQPIAASAVGGVC